MKTTLRTDARRPAWSYLGTNVEGLSLEEAIEASGIDFPVQAQPAFAALLTNEEGLDYKYKIIPVPGTQTVYRPDTDEVLAYVGNRYRVAQTREVINLVEELVGGGWKPLYGGLLRRGRQVFMVGELPFGTAHGIDPFLAFVNSFDGTTGVRLAMTPIRAKCMNAVRRTFQRATASVSLRHTDSMRNGVEEIRQALGLARVYYDRLDEDITKLMSVGLDEYRMEQALSRLYPIDGTMTENQRNRRMEKRDAVFHNLSFSPTIDESDRDNAWGLWNSVSELEQWGREVTEKNRATLLGAQMGTNTITLQSDRLYRLIDTWV